MDFKFNMICNGAEKVKEINFIIRFQHYYSVKIE